MSKIGVRRVTEIKRFFIILIIIINLSTILNIETGEGFIYDVPAIESQSTINSRIIFDGFDQSLVAKLLSGHILDDYLYRSYEQDYTEKRFMINREYVVASDEFHSDFSEKIMNISFATTKTFTDGSNETGRFIPAQETLDWLTDSYEDNFGERPNNGYTLILTNMSEIDDSIYKDHWYNETYFDPDSNAPVTRSFMTGYGNQDRLYFLDLSSDSYKLEDAGENGIIQDMTVLYDYNTEYGLNRYANYFGTWIYEIERNLWVQNFVYSPRNYIGDYQTGLQYFFEILVLTNVTGKTAEELKWTVNESKILESFRDLIPSTLMNISVKFVELSTYTKLHSLVQSSLVNMKQLNPNLTITYGVDIWPMYQYLSQSIDSYMSFDGSASVGHFRTICFLFDDAEFGVPEKTNVNPGLLGIALRDSRNKPMSIVGHSYSDLYGNRSDPKKQFGLTQTIIHENGHQVGLMHPFQYAAVGDFVADPMSYYAYSSTYSIFSKDNLRRAHVDVYLKDFRSILNYHSQKIDIKVYSENLVGYLSSLNDTYIEILQEYNDMSYGSALSKAKEFYKKILDIEHLLDLVGNKNDPDDLMILFFMLSLIFLSTTMLYYTKYKALITHKEDRDLISSDLTTNLLNLKRKRDEVSLLRSSDMMALQTKKKGPGKEQEET